MLCDQHRNKRKRAEQEEKLSCDVVSMKALAEFLEVLKRIDLEAIPNWDERSGLCKCPFPTPHSCPALEKAMTLDVPAKAEGSLKGIRAVCCCLAYQQQRCNSICGHE